MRASFKSSQYKGKMPAYVALSTVLILVGIAGIFLSFGYLMIINFNESSALKRDAIVSHSLANSCAEIAISELQEDITYAAGNVYAIGSETCSVSAIGGAGNNNRTIQTTAQYGRTQATVEVVIDTIRPNVIISQWRRI